MLWIEGHFLLVQRLLWEIANFKFTQWLFLEEAWKHYIATVSEHLCLCDYNRKTLTRFNHTNGCCVNSGDDLITEIILTIFILRFYIICLGFYNKNHVIFWIQNSGPVTLTYRPIYWLNRTWTSVSTAGISVPKDEFRYQQRLINSNSSDIDCIIK